MVDGADLIAWWGVAHATESFFEDDGEGGAVRFDVVLLHSAEEGRDRFARIAAECVANEDVVCDDIWINAFAAGPSKDVVRGLLVEPKEDLDCCVDVTGLPFAGALIKCMDAREEDINFCGLGRRAA